MKLINAILFVVTGVMLSGGTIRAVLSGQTTKDAPSATVAKSNDAKTTAEGTKAAPSVEKNSRPNQRPARAQAKSADLLRHQTLARGNQMRVVRASQSLSRERRIAAEGGPRSGQPSVQLAGVQKGMPMQIAASNAGAAIRSSRSMHPNTPILGTALHRAANPPAISGTSAGHRMNSSTIDGAVVHRR